MTVSLKSSGLASHTCSKVILLSCHQCKITKPSSYLSSFDSDSFSDILYISYLFKGDPVVLPIEDVDLLHVVVLAPNKLSLSRQSQLRVLRALQTKVFANSDIAKYIFVTTTFVLRALETKNANSDFAKYIFATNNLCGFVPLCVVKDKKGNPHPVDIFQGKSVLRTGLFQVEVFYPVVVPADDYCKYLIFILLVFITSIHFTYHSKTSLNLRV